MVKIISFVDDLLSPSWEPNDCSLISKKTEDGLSIVYCHFSGKNVFAIDDKNYFDLFIDFINYAAIISFYNLATNEYSQSFFDRKIKWYESVISDNSNITFEIDNIEIKLKDVTKENILSFFNKGKSNDTD